MQAATRSRLTLACILVTILLDMIGVGIIVPVLPELLEDLTGGSVADAAVIGGYLIFAYAFMQFVFSPVLGNLSDRFGRRPVLLASLLGLTFDYLMMSIAPVVWYLFIGRIIAGIAGAALATATAYMADITPPHKRTHRFGLIGAAFGLGFIIGPVIGGELGEFGPRVPFYAAAGLAFANFLFGLLVLPESLPKASRRKFDIRRANPLGAVVALKAYPSVLWLLAVLFFFQLSAQALPTVFSYFTVEVFNFSSSAIGRTLGAFGLGFAISQAVIAGPLSRGIGEPAVAMIGLLAAVAAFAALGFSSDLYMLYLAIMVGAVSGLAPPAINGVLSRQVPDNSQGELQGAVNAASSLATIIGPLAATQIFSYYTTTPGSADYFPGAPFLAASVSVFAALVIFAVAAWRFELGRRPSVADHPHVPETPPPGQVRIAPIEEDADGNPSRN
ncbi:TCR/Tet family MFS transporter [Devosia ginsengisoli]|uniref:TCR/Tet family MFS transporter n=1 Tax=Devosia ginsengisoli TaxID=400770 RepID=A0A5B8LRA2_9HYPH|nr:TCR/Tet family MFS transporter [Devosia ginsengisoli]QDZ10626.1 TCR/Tet family MFS transporter [Devosia ginsengisoli]